MKSFVVGALVAIISTGAVANELIVTPSASKAGSVFALDYATDGSAVAVQYTFALPKGVTPEQVDLSRCGADLPKGLAGECSVAKGKIIGYAINDANVPFPAGVLSIGSVGFKGVTVKSLKVMEVISSDKNASTTQSAVKFADN